jgi:ribosomal protein L40E
VNAIMAHDVSHCGNCGADVPISATRCVVCGHDVGYPNVRLADDPGEISALKVRLSEAEASAMGGGYSAELSDFRTAVASSYGVMARSLSALDSFLNSDNALLAKFYKQVRAEERVPENNAWDRGRTAADSTVNPLYYEEIHCALLSLTGRGDPYYGAYSMTFKPEMIEVRTSVFEQNPFVFCDRKGIPAGGLPPMGYRASWTRRDELAAAKLHHKLRPGMKAAQFQDILLERTTDGRDGDFVEIHIYGAIHRRAVKKIAGPIPPARDKAVWRQISRVVDELGIEFEEVK